MYIGIDLGGTNIAAGLVNDEGQIIYPVQTPTLAERGLDDVVADMIKLIKELQDYHKDHFKGSVKGIGIGVPGPVCPDLSEVYYCTNLGWNDVPLKKIIEKDIKMPVFVDNDANLAALAEHEIGALKEVENGILLTLGTGIGGGLIFNNMPYRGSHGLGEVGHIVIGENFYNCNCGKNGCFETFSSATAIIKYATKLIEEKAYMGSILDDAYKENRLNAKAIIDAAKEGDELGLDVFERFTKFLAIGMNNLINLLDPDVIALGGGVAHAGDFLYDAIDAKLSKLAFVENFPTARIVPAKMGNDAGIIGAGFLAKIELEA